MLLPCHGGHAHAREDFLALFDWLTCVMAGEELPDRYVTSPYPEMTLMGLD